MAGHDPGRNPEEEGIPDLQDGSPEQYRASDPQQMPVPGDEPTAANRWGTTPFEQQHPESLDERLREEEPDLTEEDATDEVADEKTGLLSDDPDSPRPRNQDMFSHRDPQSGLSAEEEAVHIPADQDRL
jgi:hypothetical protein